MDLLYEFIGILHQSKAKHRTESDGRIQMIIMLDHRMEQWRRLHFFFGFSIQNFNKYNSIIPMISIFVRGYKEVYLNSWHTI